MLKSLSIILFFLGLFLIAGSTLNITESFVGIPYINTQVGTFSGFLFIVISIILTIGESGLESKIKSYRRHLEKKEHRKINYEETKPLFEEAEKRYWDAVSRGIIRITDKLNPLKWIEDYIKEHPPKEEEKQEHFVRNYTVSYMKDPTSRRLAEEAKENQRVKKDLDNLLELYKKGHNKPGGEDIVHVEGTAGINEFRSRRGARIYWRGNINAIDIVGISDKHNQDRVIIYLKMKYPKK